MTCKNDRREETASQKRGNSQSEERKQSVRREETASQKRENSQSEERKQPVRREETASQKRGNSQSEERKQPVRREETASQKRGNSKSAEKEAIYFFLLFQRSFRRIRTRLNLAPVESHLIRGVSCFISENRIRERISASQAPSFKHHDDTIFTWSTSFIKTLI